MRHGWNCVFWLRWRRPLSHYLSFFRWGVLTRLRPRVDAAPALFLEWVRRNPDLQSAILLDSSASTRALRIGNSGSNATLPAAPRPPPPLRREDVNAALSLYSVLGTTERFADGARAVTRRLGWPDGLSALDGAPAEVAGAPSACPMRRDASRWYCFNASRAVVEENRRVLRAICPDAAACARVVAESAPLDAETHARAQGDGGGRSHAGVASSSGSAVAAASTNVTCVWRPLCAGRMRRVTGCVREVGMSLAERLAAAPSFEPGSGACYEGEKAVLSRAWLSHPQGGKVLSGRPFGRLLRLDQ